MFTKAERLISLRNLRPKKKEGFLKIISIFSFLGIMLGVAILIIVMSVMNGFKTDLTNKILGLNPHIVVQPNGFVINDNYVTKLKEKFNEIYVSKTYSGEGIIIINDKAKGVIFKGINNKENKIKKFLKNKNYWCAASTHNNEEIISGNVHLRLKKKIKNLINFIIPRHIQRTEDIVNSLLDLNLKVHCHSSKENIGKGTDIYIVDTYGETNAFFKVNGTVFLGGSLIKHGGQNPIEAARNGCNILYGPHVKNFKEVYELLDKNKVSFQINNIEQLTSKVGNLIKKNKGSKNLEDKINKLGKKILKKTLFEFKFYLNKI